MLTKEDISMLLVILDSTPIQGTLRTLPSSLGELMVLKQKLLTELERLEKERETEERK